MKSYLKDIGTLYESKIYLKEEAETANMDSNDNVDPHVQKEEYGITYGFIADEDNPLSDELIENIRRNLNKFGFSVAELSKDIYGGGVILSPTLLTDDRIAAIEQQLREE